MSVLNSILPVGVMDFFWRILSFGKYDQKIFVIFSVSFEYTFSDLFGASTLSRAVCSDCLLTWQKLGDSSKCKTIWDLWTIHLLVDCDISSSGFTKTHI